MTLLISRSDSETQDLLFHHVLLCETLCLESKVSRQKHESGSRRDLWTVQRAELRGDVA